MRTLHNKYIGGLEIREDVYKIDIAVLDRYQSFSAELLRLSLLGITGYGFLIANIILKEPDKAVISTAQIPPYVLDKLLPLGAVALALSVMTALAHRYFSTDCLAHYVRRIRLSSKYKGFCENGVRKYIAPEDKTRMEEAEDVDCSNLKSIIKHEDGSLKKDLILCKWLLLVSGIFLILGTVCVAVSFAVILSGSHSK